MENNDTSSPFSQTKSQPMRAGLPHGLIEPAPQLGENEPVDPSGFHPRRTSESVQELNRFVEAFPGQAPVYPIDGDALARFAAKGMQRQLQEITGVELLPWQVTYMQELARGSAPMRVSLGNGRRKS